MKTKIMILVLLLSNLVFANSITISWLYQPDKTTDFTVGERDGVVTLTDGQGINFRKLIVDNSDIDFTVRLVTDDNGKNYHLTAPENSKAQFIEIGEFEAHTLPLAPETGYSSRPVILRPKNTYCMITADGFHYARLYVISQLLETPESGSITTGNNWFPVELTYTVPVIEEKMERFELPYLDEEITEKGEINISSLNLVEHLTDKRIEIAANSLKEIVNYPQIVRDTIIWWNRGKVLKYYKMKRRYTYIDVEEGFMDLRKGPTNVTTTFPPDTSFFLFRNNGKTDTVYFTGFFWMEELGKSKYSYVWDRTYNERKERKFALKIKF